MGVNGGDAVAMALEMQMLKYHAALP